MTNKIKNIPNVIKVTIFTGVVWILSIIFTIKYDLITNPINLMFFVIDMLIFVGFIGVRVYRDYKIKDEMYSFNEELKKIESNYITYSEYQEINEKFVTGKYDELKSEWDSFKESIFVKK